MGLPFGANGRPTGYQWQAHRGQVAGPFGTNGRPISAFLCYESLPPPPSWRHKWEIRHLGGGRRANWDNGRLVRCRSRTWTVHGTGETPVLPVSPPPTSHEPPVALRVELLAAATGKVAARRLARRLGCEWSDDDAVVMCKAFPWELRRGSCRREACVLPCTAQCR